MPLKNLPLLGQTFAEIIDNDLLYADKTRYIYDLLNDGADSFFLSRPTRFGKTLFLSTLEELFTGDRRRFEGLWIGGSDYDFPRYPVIRLSLSMSAPSPEVFEANLNRQLSIIARKAGLELDRKHPQMYFNHLIWALSKKFGARVAVLVDEYDAAVSDNIGDLRIAEANAEILRSFLGTLKDLNTHECLAFTLVTGITKYTLVTMQYGPDHLMDVSMKPRYAGICGFTPDELDTLFADRMEGTLASLVKAGQMSPSATLDDLRTKILHWYGGYNWGGETRVLNPYSILHFFSNNAFDSYWIKSGRPAHLTTLIKARPLDFLAPELDSYLSSEERGSAPARLGVPSVLFHSGYLTVDRINEEEKVDPTTGETEVISRIIRFRQPNYEVESDWVADLFSVILNLGSIEELKPKAEKLREALIIKDGEDVAGLFETIFKAFGLSQKPDCVADFHQIAQGFLKAMSFKILTDDPDLNGRPEMLLELSERERVIIGLRHHAKKEALTDRERTSALAHLARTELRRGVLDRHLSDEVVFRLWSDDIGRILKKANEDRLTVAAKERLLADEAKRLLDKDEMEKVFADAAEEELPAEDIDLTLQRALADLNLTDEGIDQALSKAAQGALEGLETRGCHGALERAAENITCLGLGIYGHGERVKTVFCPAQESLAKSPSIPGTPDSSEAVTKL